MSDHRSAANSRLEFKSFEDKVYDVQKVKYEYYWVVHDMDGSGASTRTRKIRRRGGYNKSHHDRCPVSPYDSLQTVSAT